jgi:hypothetical protein
MVLLSQAWERHLLRRISGADRRLLPFSAGTGTAKTKGAGGDA